MSRTARAVAGVALIGVAVGIASGWAWSAEATANADVNESIDVVEIDNDNGNVQIRVDNVTTTTVLQRFSYRFDEPGDAFEVDGSTLKLKDCGWWCSVDYEVVVPIGTKVTGDQDSGDLKLTGVASVDVHADSGSVTLTDVTGPVTLDLDSGDVEATGLRDDVELQLDSGNADLAFEQAADVTADVDSGDFTLTVPEGPYVIEGENDSGDRDIEVTNDPGAEHVLDINADSGEVTVQYS